MRDKGRGLPQFSRKRLALLRQHIGDQHLCALFHEAADYAFANAARTPCDQCHLAFKPLHRIYLLFVSVD